jgi:hypothetical protein
MNEIEYIDDFNDHPETPYIIDHEENTPTKPKTPKKKNQVYTACRFTLERPQEMRSLCKESKDIKPYKGELMHPPSKMLFATLTDHLSYVKAWENRRLSCK